MDLKSIGPTCRHDSCLNLSRYGVILPRGTGAVGREGILRPMEELRFVEQPCCSVSAIGCAIVLKPVIENKKRKIDSLADERSVGLKVCGTLRGPHRNYTQHIVCYHC